jgi:hypothetical protein
MSSPPSPATISFPVDRMNEEIRTYLKDVYGAEESDFQPGEHFQAEADISVARGILTIHDSQAGYGEFWELEDLLEKHEIPFDRYSAMDWDRPPGTRVYRPGIMFRWFPEDRADTIKRDLRRLVESCPMLEYLPIRLKAYLEALCPDYPPLGQEVRHG